MNSKRSVFLKNVHNSNLQQSRGTYPLHNLNMRRVLLLETSIRSKQKMSEGIHPTTFKSIRTTRKAK